MDNELFMSAGFPPPAHFEPSLTAMPFWQALSSAMEIQTPQLNSTIEQSSECLFNSNWENFTDGNAHFNSALSSMVSSPGDISPHSHQAFLGTPSAYISANNSCYSTPVNSPPKVNLLMMDHLIKENFNKLPSSMPLNSSSLPDFSADPGFAERAAKFSCFGSRSFNDRTSQLGTKNAELPYRSNSLMENRKLPRILSSPSIKALGSEIGVQDRKSSHSPLQGRPDLASSREEFIVSEQKATEELKSLNGESNSRKRKAVSRGKAKEQSAAVSFSKMPEANSDSIAKRCKRNEDERQDNADVRADEEKKGNSVIALDEKQTKANQRPPEPPKDYIHVRARRGQATDSHSLAERVRREKISDRMKLLQDLVPGCNKVNGKALMLEEIINYVQSLQQQVEFLSMKLATVNTIPDFNVNTSVTKNTYQPNNSVPHPIFSIDSSTTSAFYGHQSQQNPTLGSNISSGTVTQCSMDPLNSSLSHNFGMQLPSLNKFKEVVPQFPTYYEDGLQSLVQMGYRKDPNQEAALQ